MDNHWLRCSLIYILLPEDGEINGEKNTKENKTCKPSASLFYYIVPLELGLSSIAKYVSIHRPCQYRR
mgnify:FL=1